MKRWKNVLLLGVTLITLLSSTPVAAGAETAIPPIPEWPIIGPVLRWLGLGDEEAPVAEVPPPPTPDPNVPRYDVETLDDVWALQELPANAPVRVVATDAALNAIVQAQIAGTPGVRSFVMRFDEDSTTARIVVARSLLEQNGLMIPDIIGGDQLSGGATVELAAEACRLEVAVKEVRINGQRIGLRRLAQDEINAWIDEEPAFDDICVEQVTIVPGEITVEGYRK